MKLTVAAVLVAVVIMSMGGGGARAADQQASTAAAAAAAGAGGGCDNSTATKGIMTACQAYVVGMTPLPMSGKGAYDCCVMLRSAPLSCLCSTRSMPSYVLQLINLPAVKTMMQTCGLQIPSGYTCGGVKLGN